MEYQKRDFERCEAAINVTAFESYDAGSGFQTMGDCCSITLDTQLDVIIVIPSSGDLETLEHDTFVLLSPLIGNRTITLTSLRTQPHSIEDSFPVTIRVLRFAARIRFNPADPGKLS